ncbi:MAG: hypothetical protein ACP5QE_06385 [Conexivisphaera sp.]
MSEPEVPIGRDGVRALRLVEVTGTRRGAYVLHGELVMEDGTTRPATIVLADPIEVASREMGVKVKSPQLVVAIRNAAEPLIKKYKRAEEIRNHWAVVALTEGPGAAVHGKLLPYSLFSRLKASGDVYYTSPEDIEEQDLWFDEVPGWHATEKGKKVIEEEARKAVDLDPELKAEVERRLAKKEEEARREARAKELIAELVRLERELDEAEMREGKYLEELNYIPEGERVDDPRWPENIYGGGRWWVIEAQKNRILAVRNNGADGDDWSRNNIRTGGAGAIGFGIPLTPERVAALRRIAEIAAELKSLGYGDPDVVDMYARGVKA